MNKINFHSVYITDECLGSSPAFDLFVSRPTHRFMNDVIKLVSIGNRNRKIKMRQPLANAKIFSYNPYLYSQKQINNILFEEWNIKSLDIFDIRCFTSKENKEEHVEFDINLTPQLIEEGWVNEFMRAVQVYRKNSGFKAEQKLRMNISAGEQHNIFINNYKDTIEKDINVVFDSDLVCDIELVVDKKDKLKIGLK